ncbi:MAG: hypothetical protein Q7S87_03165 [Agitococcus sp.]|nr:hypothetical protein [Agitococcus sp.]
MPERTATTDFSTAISNNYIGDGHLYHNPLMTALTGRNTPIIVYYYGKRDAELDQMFGYSQPKEH